WGVDNQIEVLNELKKLNLLDFNVTRIDDDNAVYTITQIDSAAFKLQLTDYLGKYRNDELIGETEYTYAKNLDNLEKYLSFSTREEPEVNPMNIWSNWTPSS